MLDVRLILLLFFKVLCGKCDKVVTKNPSKEGSQRLLLHEFSSRDVLGLEFINLYPYSIASPFTHSN